MPLHGPTQPCAPVLALSHGAWPTDEDDSTLSDLEQMIAGELTPAEVVHGNRACGCTVGVLVDQDDCQAAGAQTLEFPAIPTRFDRRDEDSGNSLFVEETKVALLALG
jgi:hypothetical protein